MIEASLEAVRRKLQGMRLTEVADACGISHPTISKVARGDTNVTVQTVQKLEAYFKERGE